MRIDGYEVRKLTARDCIVTRYHGAEDEVIVPASFQGLRPVSLGPGFLPKRNKVRSLTLPSSVEEIDPDAIGAWKSMERIECQGKALKSKDGILYDGSLRTLLVYPAGREDREYMAPPHLKSIAPTAFLAGTKLRSLVLPGTIESLGFNSADAPFLSDIFIEDGKRLHASDGVVYDGKSLVFYPSGKKARHLSIENGCERIVTGLPDAVKSLSAPASLKEGLEIAVRHLEEIEVDEGNRHYSAQDDVLFSSDSRLLAYPDGKSGAFYIVPGWVRRLEDRAFQGSRVETLVLSEGVRELGAEVFSASSIRRLVLPSTLKTIDPHALSGAGQLEEAWLHRGGLPELYIASADPRIRLCYIAENPCGVSSSALY